MEIQIYSRAAMRAGRFISASRAATRGPKCPSPRACARERDNLIITLDLLIRPRGEWEGERRPRRDRFFLRLPLTDGRSNVSPSPSFLPSPPLLLPCLAPALPENSPSARTAGGQSAPSAGVPAREAPPPSVPIGRFCRPDRASYRLTDRLPRILPGDTPLRRIPLSPATTPIFRLCVRACSSMRSGIKSRVAPPLPAGIAFLAKRAGAESRANGMINQSH
jgi:hypothetical protein